jgi:hypothetical protein
LLEKDAPPESMTHIRKIFTSTQTVYNDEVVAIMQNMAGENIYLLAIKHTLPLWEVSKYIANDMNLYGGYSAIHLAIDCNMPSKLTPMGELQPLLVKTNNIMQILIDSPDPKYIHPHFICPHCHTERYSWDCLECHMEDEKRCLNCNHDNPHACCNKK